MPFSLPIPLTSETGSISQILWVDHLLVVGSPPYHLDVCEPRPSSSRDYRTSMRTGPLTKDAEPALEKEMTTGSEEALTHPHLRVASPASLVLAGSVSMARPLLRQTGPSDRLSAISTPMRNEQDLGRLSATVQLNQKLCSRAMRLPSCDHGIECSSCSSSAQMVVSGASALRALATDRRRKGLADVR